MEYDMVIYESEDARNGDPSDTRRFDASCESLKAAGIVVGRVMCTSPTDLPEGEASDIVAEQGMGALPLAMY